METQKLNWGLVYQKRDLEEYGPNKEQTQSGPKKEQTQSGPNKERTQSGPNKYRSMKRSYAKNVGNTKSSPNELKMHVMYMTACY